MRRAQAPSRAAAAAAAATSNQPPPLAVEPFEAVPGRGYRLNRKQSVAVVRFITEMPEYLETHPEGVAYIVRRPLGQTPEASLDKLCDGLGGRRRSADGDSLQGPHGSWASTLVYYGKSGVVHTIGRGCSAPLLCPHMPNQMRHQQCELPSEDDPVPQAAIERAEAERNPQHVVKEATDSFYRAHRQHQCPHREQDYLNLGAADPKGCDGAVRLRTLPSGLSFLGCARYERGDKHRFIRVPPSVDKEYLKQLIDSDGAQLNDALEQPRTCLYLQSRWARAKTCPLEPSHVVQLVYAGQRNDSNCPVAIKAYSFKQPRLADYTVVVLIGTHTHPRAIRTLHLGKFRSRVLDILDNEPGTTRVALAAKIRDEIGLEPNSSALKHAVAEYKLSNNPLGEDQVGIMARMAAAAGGQQYVRKVVFGAVGGAHQNRPYSYVTFFLDQMVEIATTQRFFCADLSFKEFGRLARPANAARQWHLFSITCWNNRLKRTITLFKAAVIGECDDVYRELFGEFCVSAGCVDRRCRRCRVRWGGGRRRRSGRGSRLLHRAGAGSRSRVGATGGPGERGGRGARLPARVPRAHVSVRCQAAAGEGQGRARTCGCGCTPPPTA